jgi:hypothetical protein
MFEPGKGLNTQTRGAIHNLVTKFLSFSQGQDKAAESST